ncbi:hypothetical protein HRR83_004728 [Exophiala dermatitidis]|uniref:Uncharacterized protein n=1 Tax=Exophiala dermatitidis TaxID=5970 RepID=A0AAN6EYQ7_EXODE|nr:hypothetical protein HRR75_003658 [Exophiala dermatitidis]KAJ4519250.1 hypothetical protein HRR74_003991 [Exophiala dermatitidis]KAJ4529066.1 hypothetical protein HRR73_000086 [Exophiala dermatitidis]KAJ4538464.1 hypothetical protein HRR77_006948 [Exophiala dermatitidis]KAJ4544289.1 hypothetical protein HRR76_002355 [Exophiala dermatitidis]
MSSESQPISAERFALAIQDLPVENLYSKAKEISNSVSHLERSNQQLQEYINSIRTDTTLPESTRQEGDRDCAEAIQENNVVIERQKERIDLLKREVGRRGGRWHEADDAKETNGSTVQTTTEEAAPEARRSTGGTLTDEELRRQMMERLGEGDDDEEGMHL